MEDVRRQSYTAEDISREVAQGSDVGHEYARNVFEWPSTPSAGRLRSEERLIVFVSAHDEATRANHAVASEIRTAGDVFLAADGATQRGCEKPCAPRTSRC